MCLAKRQVQLLGTVLSSIAIMYGGTSSPTNVPGCPQISGSHMSMCGPAVGGNILTRSLVRILRSGFAKGDLRIEKRMALGSRMQGDG